MVVLAPSLQALNNICFIHVRNLLEVTESLSLKFNFLNSFFAIKQVNMAKRPKVVMKIFYQNRTYEIFKNVDFLFFLPEVLPRLLDPEKIQKINKLQ